MYSALGESVDARASAYREIFKGHLDDELIIQIRDATNQGMALGNARFKQEVKRLSGRRVVSYKRGPKPKVKKRVRDSPVFSHIHLVDFSQNKDRSYIILNPLKEISLCV